MNINVEEIIQCMKQGDENSVQTQLQDFNKKYAQSFFFDEEEKEQRRQRKLDQFRKNKLRSCAGSDSDAEESKQEDGGLILRQSLAAVVVRFLGTRATGHLLRVCLRTLRILSRDKQVLAPLVTDNALLTLAKLAGLTTRDAGEEEDTEPDFYDKVVASLAEIQTHSRGICKGEGETEENEIEEEKSVFDKTDNCEENVNSLENLIDEVHSVGLHHTVLQRGRRDRRESKKDGDQEEEDAEDLDPGEEMQRKEAMKVLCNVVYNSTKAQERFSALRLISGLIQGLCPTVSSSSPSSIQFYELRLMFLVTALRPELSTQLQQAGGVSLLTAALERCLEVQWKDQYEGSLNPSAPPISLDASQRIIEILKILFNITHSSHRKEPSEEDAALYRHLVAILRLCLMRKSVLTNDADELQGHAVNLLSALPLQCLDVLLMVPLEPNSEQCEGRRLNMDCVYTLLMFMERRLESGEKIKEKLTPILNLLTESCRAHRETRHYIRKHILPPLRDVTLRPEEGSTMKSRLIRLMTHLDTDVKHCAAELIFVLCKENVRRFVKYTGYGNAAGLLATRGLLGGQGFRTPSPDTQYSSDSDSDTEEYRQVKDRINPVTGRVEADMPDPMEGMTEEEKEEEAKRLIMLFNKLSRDNIIQPMGVSAEGKLIPMSGLRGNSLIEETQSEDDGDDDGDVEEGAKH